MKHLLMALMVLLSVNNSSAEVADTLSYKREGKVVVANSSHKSKSPSEDIVTSYVWQDSKGNQYPIVLHKITRGERAGVWVAVVYRTSATSGKKWTYYIPDGDKLAKEIMETR